MEPHITAKELAKEQNLQPFQVLEKLRDGALIGFENGRQIYDTASLKYESQYSVDEIEFFGRQLYGKEPINSSKSGYDVVPILNVRGGGETWFTEIWFEMRLSKIEWGYFRGPGLDDEYVPGQRNIVNPSDDDIRARAKEVYDLQIVDLVGCLHMSFELPTDPRVAETVLSRVMRFTFLKSVLTPKKLSGRHRHDNEMKKVACEIAKSMWDENPDLTIPEVALSDKIWFIRLKRTLSGEGPLF